MSLAALKHSVGDHTQQDVTEQRFTQLRLSNVTRLFVPPKKNKKGRDFFLIVQALWYGQRSRQQ